MRTTSWKRRASGRHGHAYTGKAPVAAKPLALVTVDPSKPTVACTECGFVANELTNGRPQAHANGGFRPNTRRGLYKCEGSGRS
jgi:hypothetical protein